MRKEWRAKKKASDPTRKKVATKGNEADGDRRPQTSGPLALLGHQPPIAPSDLSIPLPMAIRPATAPQGFHHGLGIHPSAVHHQVAQRNTLGDSLSDNPFQFAAPPMMQPQVQRQSPVQPPPSFMPMGYPTGRRSSLPMNNLEQIPEQGGAPDFNPFGGPPQPHPSHQQQYSSQAFPHYPAFPQHPSYPPADRRATAFS